MTTKETVTTSDSTPVEKLEFTAISSNTEADLTEIGNKQTAYADMSEEQKAKIKALMEEQQVNAVLRGLV